MLESKHTGFDDAALGKNEKQVEEGHKSTAGHSYWFSDNPKWLILAWVTAGLQISNDHTVQKKMLMTLWTTTF